MQSLIQLTCRPETGRKQSTRFRVAEDVHGDEKIRVKCVVEFV